MPSVMETFSTDSELIITIIIVHVHLHTEYM